MTDGLVVDIGNSAVKAGRYRNGKLVATCRAALREAGWDREAGLEAFLTGGPVASAALVSVVPKLVEPLVALLAEVSSGPVVRIDARSALPFRLAYETPDTLGADRLAAAAAAWAWSRRAHPAASVAIAVDAGTALNVEVVVSTADGPAYLGGVIAAGPDLLRRALNAGTAQLPLVDLEWPGRAVGSSTSSALQAGILPAFVHGVDGVLGGIEQDLGHPAAIVATGGWAHLLAAHLPRIDAVDPDLVLRGIADIAALNGTD